MLTLLFIILMIAVFGKLILLPFKATWGIAKILFTILFLPILLIGLFFGGLVYLAIPILLLVGVYSLINA